MSAGRMLPGRIDERHKTTQRVRRPWIGALCLVALVLIAYVRVFPAGFIWDDESHLTRNPCVVGPLGLKEIWTSAQAVYYPLVLTTFWLLHKLAGLTPWPYHLLNVLFHAGSAVLLWQALRKLSVRGAWFGAALWALHPVMVQSVAWVTELKNTQSGFFYLLAILWFLKWRDQFLERESPGGGSSHTDAGRTTMRRSLMLSLFFFLLATLSKPSVVMFPFVLALCVWWQGERIQWRDILAIAPFALVSAAAGLWTIWEQKFHARAIGPDWSQSLAERLVIAGRALWFYLGKLIWPDPLIFIYQRWAINAADVSSYLPFVAVIIALAGLWCLRAKWARAAFFAAAYYAISLFPVLGFFDVYFFRYSFVSDHFQYLASMGPLAFAGAAIATGYDWLGRSRRVAMPTMAKPGPAVTQRVLIGFCAGLLLMLGAVTWRQSGEYRDLVTLYTATLAKDPGCWMAHYNLGIVFANNGTVEKAIAHYRQAIALRPAYAEAHYNLGRLLAEKGELGDAITEYEAVLKINPDDADAHNNLGVALFQTDRVEDAITHYEKALAIRPDDSAISCNLGAALLAKGDLDGAINRYLECLAAAPTMVDARYNLASALLRKGRFDEAIFHFQKALALAPDNADAHANLGSAFLAKGRIKEAIGEYRKALQFAPDNLAAQSNLAWLLATAADPSLRNGLEAVRLAEQAESAGSRGSRRPLILRVLAAAYAEAGRFTEAAKTAEEALAAAETQQDSALTDNLRWELALYRSGRPYRKNVK